MSWPGQEKKESGSAAAGYTEQRSIRITENSEDGTNTAKISVYRDHSRKVSNVKKRVYHRDKWGHNEHLIITVRN